MENKFNVVKCPKCNYEYLIEEIFLPNTFFGKPRDIIRDYDGKIISFLNNSINTKEVYKCDNCNTNFEVKLDIKSHCKSIIFKEEYTQKL